MAGPKKNHTLAIGLLFAMFAIWGLSHRLSDVLSPGFEAALSLNRFQITIEQWSKCLGYCLSALPAAFLIRNLGLKTGVVAGLGCFAVGMFLFYPAAEHSSFAFLLGACFVANVGLALLEISADPLVMRLGSVDTAVRRLNIAQALNPVGVVTGFFLGQLILSERLQHTGVQLAHALVQPYFLIGAAVLMVAFAVDNTEFPPVAGERVGKKDSTIADLAALRGDRVFLFGLLALVLYCMGQIVLWGFATRYGQSAAPGVPLAASQDFLLWALIAFMAGRLVGAGLMFRIDPAVLLAAFAGASTLFTAGAILGGGLFGMVCIIAASFFLSILFPTIFGCVVRDLGPRTKSASAVLIMFSGMASITLPVLNLLVDAPRLALTLPLVCFGAVAAFGVAQIRREKTAIARS